MPRKSAALRLKQSKDLFEGYEKNSIGGSYQGRFISDIIQKLSVGRGLSKRQRDWIDSLIEEGVPEPKGDPETISKLDASISQWRENSRRNWEINVLSDFKSQLVQGRDLSEKQKTLMEKLVKKAEDDAIGANVYTPNEEELSDLNALVKLYGGYSPMWRSDRPGLAKAVHIVSAFLCGECDLEVYHYEKLCKSMSAKLKQFKNPRFSKGDLGWSIGYDQDLKTPTNDIVTCLTDVYVSDNGSIVNDWLVGGSVITKEQGTVKKRR